MAESYPGKNPDFGSNSEKGGKKETVGGSRFEMPKSTPRKEIRKSAGYETLKFGEGLKPLGESFKPAPEHKTPPPETSNETKGAAESGHWREASADELRARAAQDAAEQLAYHHRSMFEEESKKFSEDDDDDEPVAKHDARTKESDENQSEIPQAILAPENHEIAEVSPLEEDVFDNIMERNAPELTDAMSGDQLEEASITEEPVGPEVERAPSHNQESDVTFTNIANAPELADLASKSLPEAPGKSVDELEKPEEFSEWLANEHPELHAPEMAAASDPDEGFNDIIRNNFGGSEPGETRYFEQEPGEEPVDMDAGGNQPPDYPPTAQGGQRNNPGNGPNQNRAFNRYYPPNPNILNNPWTPAGGLTNPNTWAVISAMQARNEINNLKHTAREIGLAGAVGLLGLGLIADHLWARRRFRKQKRQIKEQGKQIAKTGEALQQEQASHNLTKQRLDRVAAEQTATANRLNTHGHEAAKAAALETGYFAGSVANGLHSETSSARSAHNAEQASKLENQDLARYLENNREAGRAIMRNPELKNNAEFAVAVAALGAESVEASKATEKSSFNQEGTHEQLKNQYLDSGGAKRSSAGTTPQGSASFLPSSQQQYGTFSDQNSSFQPSTAEAGKTKKKSVAAPVTAGAAVLIIVAVWLYFFVV